MMRMRAVLLGVVLLAVACDRGAVPAASPPAVAPAVTGSTPAAAPGLLATTDVDALLRTEWQRAGVTPVRSADDATWLRRLWLDVLGTIPPPEVARRFLADRSQPAPVARARMVDEVLASPLWADHWTSYWDDVWMGRAARAPDVDRGAFRAWLHGVLARNVAWSEVVTELLTATGQNSEGGSRREAYASDGKSGAPAGVNGAVNWTLRYQKTPQDLAGTASRTLLGVQIQCAQCHDHKTEKWTQKDFQSFAAAFVRTRLVPIDRGKAMGEVKRVELRDLDRPAPRFAKMGDLGDVTKARPAALDGTDLDGQPGGVRSALARWVTSPQNPWFARAFVNRMWGHFLGRGFVDPVDDLRPSNPPVASALLDALAADFVASGYDVKHLVRLIAGSDAYALAAVPPDGSTAKADPEAKLWEHFRVTPLGPEELLDSLVAATRLDAVVRATGRLDLDQVRFKVKQRYGFLFDVDEETDAGEFEGTIAQALALLDGGVTATGASVLPGSALADVLAAPGDDASKIEAIYLRTLTRLPAADEVARWTAFVTDAPAEGTTLPAAQAVPGVMASSGGVVTSAGAPAKPGAGKARQPDPLRGLEDRAGRERGSARVHAYEDMLWTILNSSEFVLNH
jgi:hypothetical protein